MYRVIHSWETENLSLERGAESGSPCLCVPFIDDMVRGGLRFRLTEEEFHLLATDSEVRQEFANKCRLKSCDERLIEPYLPRNGQPCLPGDSEGHPLVKEYDQTRTIMVFIKQWFLVGFLFESKQYFIAIMVDFSTQIQGTEDYAITHEEFDHLQRNPGELIALAGKCQRRQNEDRLITHYKFRGDPWYCPPEEQP